MLAETQRLSEARKKKHTWLHNVRECDGLRLQRIKDAPSTALFKLLYLCHKRLIKLPEHRRIKNSCYKHIMLKKYPIKIDFLHFFFKHRSL